MNKITEAMVAARDFMANRLEEARAAASHSEASLNDCSAAIAKLDEAIEAGELSLCG